MATREALGQADQGLAGPSVRRSRGILDVGDEGHEEGERQARHDGR